jgi:hypothetical protein
MMTRKDYVETADILAGVRPALESLGLEGEQIFSDLANDFAEMFATDFSLVDFLTLAGRDKWKLY